MFPWIRHSLEEYISILGFRRRPLLRGGCLGRGLGGGCLGGGLRCTRLSRGLGGGSRRLCQRVGAYIPEGLVGCTAGGQQVLWGREFKFLRVMERLL